MAGEPPAGGGDNLISTLSEVSFLGLALGHSALLASRLCIHTHILLCVFATFPLQYDWIMYLDADIVVTNPHIRIEAFLEQAKATHAAAVQDNILVTGCVERVCVRVRVGVRANVRVSLCLLRVHLWGRV